MAEHNAIIASEQNAERRFYYELLWETGASQSDAATLTAENIDFKNRILSYSRSKTGTAVKIRIGAALLRILEQLPKAGLLFPMIAKTDAKQRAAEFCCRKRPLGLEGISLHSYRYAWAQRAKESAGVFARQ